MKRSRVPLRKKKKTDCVPSLCKLKSERMEALLPLTFIVLLVSLGINISDCARNFTLINNCNETIWPAIIPAKGIGSGGFPLKPAESRVLRASDGWSGQIWGRTGCNFDKNGKGMCQSGKCGSLLHCEDPGETLATLAEFTLTTPDFYDVSVVDGFNLPMSIKPIHGKGNCSIAGCDRDLRASCPEDLAIRANDQIVACRSACQVFKTDQYCCRGKYGNSATCQPTFYSKKFKEACPNAYSYAYDDPSNIFTCSEPDYIITYCVYSQALKSIADGRVKCNTSMFLLLFFLRMLNYLEW